MSCQTHVQALTEQEVFICSLATNDRVYFEARYAMYVGHKVLPEYWTHRIWDDSEKGTSEKQLEIRRRAEVHRSALVIP